MTKREEAIVIICDRNPHTSFGRMALYFQKALSECFDVRIVWLAAPKYFPASYNLPKKSYTIRAPSLELGWWLFRRPLRKLLKEIRPRKTLLIHQGLGFLIGEIRRALPSARIDAMIHDIFPKTAHRRSLKHTLFYRGFIAPVRAADGFLYNSEYTRDETHRVMGLGKDHPVIGCPVDISAFHPPHGGKIPLKREWGLDNYRGVCLNVSLDEPRKNIATFFALAKLRPDVAFVRVGPFSQWMKEWISGNRATNIIHHSSIPIDRLLELYGCADLFIYPSYLEGFGMPPLEALACGVPVVAANTSALKENLEGVVPLIDPPDRIEGYLEVIDDVLAGKNVVNREAAKALLDRFSFGSFEERVRSCVGG